MRESLRGWVALVIGAAVFLMSGAGFVGAKVVEDMGERTYYGDLLRSSWFLAYYWLLMSAFLVVAYLILGSVVHSWGILAAGALGAIPEGSSALIVLESVPRELAWSLASTISAFNSPGTLLYRCLTGYEPHRWAAGVLEAPTRWLMLEASTIGSLNMLVYLAIALIARSLYRMKRR